MCSEAGHHTPRQTTGSALNIKGVHHVTLVVGDLTRAESFYGKFLGLQPIPRPDYDFQGTWYRCGNLELHLIVAEEHPPPSRHHIAFEVADFDNVLKVLDSGRVHIVGGPARRLHDNSRYVFCQDPDGNLIEITSPTR